MQFTQPRVWDRRTKKTTHLQSARITNSARISHFRYALLIFSFISAPNLQAAPSGGQIVGGVGSIHQSGLTTTIQQQTSAMAIDWNTFNVNVDERVQFQQPDVSSIALNRILDQLPSQINGRLDANGRIVLVNPNGLFFGNNASVNVGGLIASGLDIDPMDFMNGDYQFEALENSAGTVFNAGLIQASLGGSVALLGKQVQNQGMISADLGIVALAAGKQAVLTFDHSGLLGLRITEAVLQDELGIDPAVLNSGDISAAGGKVLMTASVSQDVFSEAVNTGDLQAARSVVVNADGSVTLGSGADLVNTGTVNVSSESSTSTGQIVMLGANITQRGVIRADQQTTATNPTGTTAGQIELHAQDTLLLTDNSLTSASSDTGRGGEITLLGNQIGLFDQARLALNGDTGGGSLLFGGDLRGENPDIPNASAIYIGEATSIQADAIRDGDGGRIIIYATDSAKVFGNISATGGALGGDGGFLETSAGVVNLDFAVDVGAANGNNGQWLIDPFSLSICASCDDNVPNNNNTFVANSLLSQLLIETLLLALSSSDVTVETGDGGFNEPDGGNITLRTELNYNGNNSSTLTLNAHHDIVINHSIIDSDTDSNDTLNLVFNADSNGMNGGDVVINNGVMIDTNDGSFAASGEGFNLANGSSIDTGTGDFKITTNGLVDADGKLVVGGNVDINAGNSSIRLLNTGNLFTGEVSLKNRGANNVTLINSGALTLGSLNVGSGTLNITAVGITQSGSITQADDADAATFNAGAGVLALNSGLNRFTGAVSLNNSGNNDVTLVHNGALTLGSSNVGSGTLAIATQSNITQSGAIVQTGTGNVRISAVLGPIELDNVDNDFQGTLSLGTLGATTVRDKNSLTLGDSVISELTIISDGNVNASNGALVVLGKTSINAGDGFIKLTDLGNRFEGEVSLQNTGNNAIEIVNSTDLELGALNVGSGTLEIITVGNITQSGAIVQTGTGNVRISALLGSIELDNVDNDFQGTLSLLTLGATTVRDKNSLTLGNSFINRELTIISDGNIDASNGALIVVDKTSINAGDGFIKLTDPDNIFVGEVSLQNTGNNAIDIVNSTDLELGGIALEDGALSITANGGDITQSGAIVQTGENAGNVTITAKEGLIELNNGNNDFQGTLFLNSFDATVRDKNSLTLGDSFINRELTINSDGDIDASNGELIVGNETFINAGDGFIKLTNSDNRFGGEVFLLNLDTNAIEIVNSTDLELGGILLEEGALTITANGGDITQSGSIAQISENPGNVTITVKEGFEGFAGSIELNNVNNEFSGTVSLNSANDASLVNSVALTLAESSIGGDLTIKAITGNITQIDKLNVARTASFTVADGESITLNNAGNNIVGNVSFTEVLQELAFVNNQDISLGALNIAGGLVLNSTRGSIGQTGAWVVAGKAELSAADDIILDNMQNDFNVVLLTADKLTLSNQNKQIFDNVNIADIIDMPNIPKTRTIGLALKAAPQP